ncbi:hypothetical protein D3C72_2244420 [compost metagenome]
MLAAVLPNMRVRKSTKTTGMPTCASRAIRPDDSAAVRELRLSTTTSGSIEIASSLPMESSVVLGKAGIVEISGKRRK